MLDRPEVVLVRRLVSGFWEFGGGRGGERVGSGEVNLQATWERGGRILSQLGGFQVSRRGLKREQRGAKQSQQGEIKARGKRHVKYAL
jgi:hypothetical protein